MVSLLSFLNSSLMGNTFISVFASAIWGILSIILSPCHLSSIPLIVGVLNNQNDSSKKHTLQITSLFSLGIAFSILVIGVITAAMGRIMGDIGLIGSIIFSLLLLIFGLYLMDLIPLSWNNIDIQKVKLTGKKHAFIIGLLFGIGLGPCTFAFMAPILGIVFTASSHDLLKSILMLFAFIIAHCGAIFIAGNAIAGVSRYLNWAENNHWPLRIKRVCGFLVCLSSFYLIYNAVWS